ncbi:MAG: zinc-ribbon domain-containing protein [Lachnospiraceae bacterium]|nr:zinc-ribbon domain-containing protein [Lachnospiraceae bacterium]
MYCNECGAELPDGSKFCSVCGTKMISLQESRQAAQPMQTGYSYDEQQNLPSKKKLPIWDKALITVCVLAVVGVATFLTIHFIKGKKKGTPAYVTIKGVKCEINDKDGVSNLDKVNDGVVFNGMGCSLYKDGEKVNPVPVFDADVYVEKGEIGNINDDIVHIEVLNININEKTDFDFSDGVSNKSSKYELEKAGYVNQSNIKYSKLFDENGEITLDSINSDYEKFLESGKAGIGYEIRGFDYNFSQLTFSGTKEENRREIINTCGGLGSDYDYDSLFKYRLLLSRELANLTGMQDGEYVGSKKDFLVQVDFWFSSDKYDHTTISIYGPKDKLNEYMTKWGLPDSTFYVSDAKITTEHYDTQEDATIEIYDPYIEIRPGADIPTEEEETPQQPVEPWEISVSDIPEYDALILFLKEFEWYRDINYECEYDSSTAADGNSDILWNIMGYQGCITRYGLYDDVYDLEEARSSKGDPADPRGYTNDPDTEWMGYRSVSEYGLRWIAQNIFNVSDEDYEALANASSDCASSYYENGRYYYAIYPLGEEVVPYNPEIQSVRTDGTRYIIVYKKVPDWDPNSDNVKEAYIAEMEIKNIDGKNYWSMYSNHLVE